MDWYRRGDPDDRRRRLIGYSRYDQTPRQLVIELNAGATDYLVHGNVAENEFTQGWQVLRTVLEDAHEKLTRRDLLTEWPDDFDAPDKGTLLRWLDQAVARCLVCRQGTGRRNDPFRYWLKGQEEKWRHDPLHLPDLPPFGGLQDVPGVWPSRRRKKPGPDAKAEGGASTE